MWELSISVNCENLEAAKFVYQTLKTHGEAFEAVVTCFEECENIIIMFACPETQKEKAQSAIERCIIKIICNFYKEKYLSQNLRLPAHENISLTAFKKAIINFDKETDFYIISKNLVLENSLHLDSFYYFKLKALRNKWSELVSLANENSDYLVSNDAFFDLLRFLIDNLEVGEEELNVFEDENGYCIHAQNEEFEKLSKEGLVSSLIELCPRKINLFCKKDENTAGFLSKIFEERINICYDKTLSHIDNFSILK